MTAILALAQARLVEKNLSNFIDVLFRRRRELEYTERPDVSHAALMYLARYRAYGLDAGSIYEWGALLDDAKLTSVTPQSDGKIEVYYQRASGSSDLFYIDAQVLDQIIEDVGYSIEDGSVESGQSLANAMHNASNRGVFREWFEHDVSFIERADRAALKVFEQSLEVSPA